MAWLILFVAGLFEVLWAYSLKQSQGFTRVLPAVITLGAMLASFGLLGYAMKTIPLGTAYPIWTGIGAVGTFIIGFTLLNETITPLRVVAALLIASGIVLMKLSTPVAAP
ncbi:MAG: QacE family quaternary ammonium compound efflux SMR transporter [Archangium sp.]|nr:QacE family quaternary ammonium compound efflux SMR transporter [Archangium sp.]